MASSSAKRKRAGSRKEMASEKITELANDVLKLLEKAEDGNVNSKFFCDQATKKIVDLLSLLPSTKQNSVTRDQKTREITTCDPKHKDGYKWEKYGKKKNKEFNDNPKDYYNCSNKRESGCPAKKHVQQVNSHEYRVIYHGSHTCGGIQNQKQQQQQSPPLDPSEHGSAITVQIATSIPATLPEPAGQNDEDDDCLASWKISEEVDRIFASLQAGQNDGLCTQLQRIVEEFKSDDLWF